MVTRIETIERSLKKRKRNRVFLIMSLIGLSAISLAFLMSKRSSKMPPQKFASTLPIAQTESKAVMETKESQVESLPKLDSNSFIPSENARVDTVVKRAADTLVQGATLQTMEPVSIATEKKEPEAKSEKKVVAEEKATRYYINMPVYTGLPLSKKMDLMRNDAYSPSDKSKLRKHIIGLFSNRNRARISVQAGAETHSYPIGMYLDRISKNPRLQFRIVEKVSTRGELSGLVVRE